MRACSARGRAYRPMTARVPGLSRHARRAADGVRCLGSHVALALMPELVCWRVLGPCARARVYACLSVCVLCCRRARPPVVPVPAARSRAIACRAPVDAHASVAWPRLEARPTLARCTRWRRFAFESDLPGLSPGKVPMTLFADSFSSTTPRATLLSGSSSSLYEEVTPRTELLRLPHFIVLVEL